MTEKFFITTPIYYPNDIPHIGHAYTTVMCDILARWNKLQGKEVLFSTGTDEHGKKIQETAEKAKVPPQEFVDQMAEKFKLAWKDLNIDYSRFIKTTDKDHQKNVQEILQKVYDKGDIYLDEYEGYYCVGCEAYLTEKELEDGCCPIHKKKVELMKEKSYFFKIQKYKDQILELFDKGFILPKNKTKEMKNRVKDLDRDLSISRTSFDWGIPLPFDKEHVAYVWFDALLNYHTVAKETDEKFWPANLHVVAKDIFYFHTVIWPAILMSADLPLSKNVFVHGYWTIENEKMSKSLGNVVNIPELISIAGVDSARYFLAREISFGEDGDFSKQALIDRHNNELANKLGNLISRTSALAEKYGIESTKNDLLKKLDNKKIEKHFEEFRIDKALNEIFAFIDNCNEFIQNKKPWETKSKTDLFQLVESIREIATLLSPFIPDTAEKIQTIFKTNKIKKAPILFQKLDDTSAKQQATGKQPQAKTDRKVNNQEIPNKSMENICDTSATKSQQATNKPASENVKVVSFQDFTKLDLRVAEIQNAEDIEGADKLYKLTLNVGELGERTICAGIKEFYNHEDLKGKKIIIIANLAPRKLRGIESCGMLLAASSKDKKTVSLVSPSEKITPGTKAEFLGEEK